MNNPELDLLKYAVEHETGVKDIFNKCRDRDHADARCLFYNYAYNHLNQSWTKLSKYSKQHHATIIYNVNRFNVLYTYDKIFQNQWKSLLDSEHVRDSILNKYNRYQRLDRILKEVKICENDLNLVFEDLKQCIIKRKEAKDLQTKYELC